MEKIIYAFMPSSASLFDEASDDANKDVRPLKHLAGG